MVGEAYGWANSHRSHWVGLFHAGVQLLPTFAPPTHFVGIDSGHDSRMIVSSTCYQRPSYGLPLLVASPLGLVPTALPWEWPVLALMATYCLFLARAHIGSESARRRWVGGDWCASQPSPPWCFLMAMAAVGGLEGSLERVLGQRKASSCSRMCCNHYTAPLGTPVTPGDTTGHAVSWSLSKYKASPDDKNDLSDATSASFEHTAIGKPRKGHRSK